MSSSVTVLTDALRLPSRKRSHDRVGAALHLPRHGEDEDPGLLVAEEGEECGDLLPGALRFKIGLGLRFADDDGRQRRIEGVNVWDEAIDPVRFLRTQRAGQVIDDPERRYWACSRPM